MSRYSLPKFCILESYLADRLCDLTSQCKLFTDATIINEARLIHESLNSSLLFKASPSWLYNFKRRYRIRGGALHGMGRWLERFRALNLSHPSSDSDDEVHLTTYERFLHALPDTVDDIGKKPLKEFISDPLNIEDWPLMEDSSPEPSRTSTPEPDIANVFKHDDSISPSIKGDATPTRLLRTTSRSALHSYCHAPESRAKVDPGVTHSRSPFPSSYATESAIKREDTPARPRLDCDTDTTKRLPYSSQLFVSYPAPPETIPEAYHILQALTRYLGSVDGVITSNQYDSLCRFCEQLGVTGRRKPGPYEERISCIRSTVSMNLG